MSEAVIEVTDKNFSNVLNGELPILVDFWAPWCNPCRAIAPIVEELATENKGKVVVGKINVDENQSTAVEYGVTGIPTLILFKNGQAVERLSGAHSKATLQGLIDKALG